MWRKKERKKERKRGRMRGRKKTPMHWENYKVYFMSSPPQSLAQIQRGGQGTCQMYLSVQNFLEPPLLAYCMLSPNFVCYMCTCTLRTCMQHLTATLIVSYIMPLNLTHTLAEIHVQTYSRETSISMYIHTYVCT